MPSQRAAEDLDGSNCAGLERPLGDEGAQPAPIDDAMRVGTIVMMDGLCEKYRPSVRPLHGTRPHNETYSATRDSGAMGALRLFPTYEEARMRPPRTCENVLRLSRTSRIAEFHSACGVVVGSTSGFGMRRILMNNRSMGPLGMQRMRAPRGIETKPRATPMPHSRPPMRVTWNAAPPTNTMRIWIATSKEGGTR